MLQEISGDKCFEVLDNNKYILFYFGASWCGPCQQVLPNLQELSKKYDSNIIEFYKIDIDLEENKNLCDKCQIKVVPAFLLFNGRKFISRTKGNNIPSVVNNMFFLMKKGHPPIWEVPQNIDGGSWSYKFAKKKADSFWL